MKYFERLSIDERKKVVLGAVGFSSAMEGMSGPVTAALQNSAPLIAETRVRFLRHQPVKKGNQPIILYARPHLADRSMIFLADFLVIERPHLNGRVFGLHQQ